MDITLLLQNVFNRKKLIRCFLAVLLPAAIFYCVSLISLYLSGFEIMEILRDPAQQTEVSSLLGFLSNIGIWLWVSSAAISFFYVLSNFNSGDKRDRELLFLAGMLSMVLAIDDFFMIHDRYVNQYICYTVYAIFAVSLFVRHFNRIIEIEGFAFLLAGLSLALSILTDHFQYEVPIGYGITQILEEGFKFMGAATWLYFIGRTASFLLANPAEK